MWSLAFFLLYKLQIVINNLSTCRILLHTFECDGKFVSCFTYEIMCT